MYNNIAAQFPRVNYYFSKKPIIFSSCQNWGLALYWNHDRYFLENRRQAQRAGVVGLSPVRAFRGEALYLL
jgi:hypothetical protein